MSTEERPLSSFSGCIFVIPFASRYRFAGGVISDYDFCCCFVVKRSVVRMYVCRRPFAPFSLGGACAVWLLSIATLTTGCGDDADSRAASSGDSSRGGSSGNSGNESSPGSPNPPPVEAVNCVRVQPSSELKFGGAGTFWGDHLSSGIDVDLGGGGYHALSLRFRGGESLRPGTYDLSEGAHRSYAECAHCVMVMENVWGDNVNTLNFQASGELTLDEVNAARGEFRGTVRNVVMVPVTPTGLHRWEGYEDTDDCVYIEEFSFDTFAGVGESCVSAGDCRNRKTQICDTSSRACTESQCSASSGGSCPGGGECIEQHPQYRTGACFSRCDPLSSGQSNGQCGAGLFCASTNYVGSDGICKLTGPANHGERCDAGTATTACEAGSVCQTNAPFWGRPECETTCDFFSSEPGCAQSSCRLRIYRDKDFKLYCNNGQCHLGGTCGLRDGRQADSAELGQRCDDAGDPCADDGKAARGICHQEGGQNRCRELCRLDQPRCRSGRCEQLVLEANGTVVEGVGVCR